jgi:hypothetical protein
MAETTDLVQISGATTRMGVYQAAGRVCDGRAVFELDGGLASIRFCASNASWMLATRKEEGTNTGFIQLAEDVASPELATKPWKEFVGGSWKENTGIKAIGLRHRWLVVGGGSDYHSARMGVYQAAGRVCDGRAVFELDGGQGSIRFCASNASWVLGTRKEEGTNTGFIQLAEDVASPELATKPWQEVVGGSWIENQKLFVKVSFSNSCSVVDSAVSTCPDHLEDVSVLVGPHNSLISCLGVDRRSNWKSNGKLGLDDQKLFF